MSLSRGSATDSAGLGLGFPPVYLCNIKQKKSTLILLVLSCRNMVIIIMQEQAEAGNWLGRVFLLILISVLLFILFILSLLS